MKYEFEKMTADELNELCDKLLIGADGVEKDVSEAAAVAKIAADRGDAKALCNYGSFLLEGTGVEKNEATALEYWRKSADMGFGPALNKVGLCLLLGLCGEEKAPSEAVAYFKKAADQGVTEGMFHLAMMYENGVGVEKDQAVADSYLAKAAEGKLPMACFMLALKKFAVKNGTGNEPKEGAELLLIAAEGGVQNAQVMYGMCCENGIGMEKDLSEAAGWYRRAAKAGNKQANDALKKLGFPGVM